MKYETKHTEWQVNDFLNIFSFSVSIINLFFVYQTVTHRYKMVQADQNNLEGVNRSPLSEQLFSFLVLYTIISRQRSKKLAALREKLK